MSRQHLLELAEGTDAAGESSFVWGRLHAHEEAQARGLDRGWPGCGPTVSRKEPRMAGLTVPRTSRGQPGMSSLVTCRS